MILCKINIDNILGVWAIITCDIAPSEECDFVHMYIKLSFFFVEKKRLDLYVYKINGANVLRRKI